MILSPIRAFSGWLVGFGPFSSIHVFMYSIIAFFRIVLGKRINANQTLLPKYNESAVEYCECKMDHISF